MKYKKMSRLKRTISGILALTMTASITNIMPVSAEETIQPYPYTMFAASKDDGAITINAGK